MSRIARIISIGIVAAIVLAASLWAILFWTPPGRQIVKEIAEAQIARAVGGEVSINALDGALPGAVELQGVRFSQDGAEWLTIDETRVRWRPAALADGALVIDHLRIAGARLVAPPPPRARAGKPRGFELPERLPTLTIRELSIEDFAVAESLAGRALRLDGVGSAMMGGKALDIRLNANSDDARDFVSADILRAGDRLDVKLTVASEPDGALALLAKTDGALLIEATGAGPINDFKIDLGAGIGAYGGASGVIAGDFGAAETFDFDLEIVLGPRFANTAQLIGERLSLDGAFAAAVDGGAIRLARAQSALGIVTGDVAWRNRGEALGDFSAALKVDLAADWRPELRRYLGDRAAITASATAERNLFIVTGAIDAALARADFARIETDLRRRASGPVTLRLAPNAALPPLLDKGATATGDAAYEIGGAIAATGAEIVTADGAAFRGDATYHPQSEEFKVKGDVTLPPAAAAALSPGVKTARTISGDIDLSGDRTDFGGRIVAATPPLRLGGRELPAMRATLAVAGMPKAPAGQASFRALDNSLRFSTNFARAADGAWRLANLAYAGPDFDLKGEGAFNPATQEGRIDLAYQGGAAAEPWPGVTLAGAMTAKGSLARGAASNNVTIIADALAAGGAEIDGLRLQATGPMDALNLDATLSALRVRGLAPMAEIASAATLRLGETVKADIASLTAKIGGDRVRLLQPARVEFEGGVAVSRLKAGVGAKGVISGDAAFTKTRWRASLAATQAPIVSAASALDFSLDLDTDRKAPASGAFTVTSQLSAKADARLAGNFSWDGAALRLSDLGGDPALSFNVALPLRLTRRPELRVDTDGALKGAAHYEGRVETIAAFLPSALQSLEGDLQFDGTAGGSLKDPKLTGALAISKGAYTELASGLSIVNIDVAAEATAAAGGSRIDFEATGAGPGQAQKTVAAKGVAALGAAPSLKSTITLDRARLSAGPIDSVVASGSVDFSGPFDNLEARGELSVRELNAEVFTPESTGLVNINVVRINGDGAAPEARSKARPPTRLTYAIRIVGDDRIFVRGRGLNSEWRSDIRIIGSATAPLILGGLTLKKGDITFAGRQFDMTTGSIAFDALSPNDPALDLRATRETRSGATATITIGGRGRAPVISLSSTPSLPPEDIMALVLFDKPATELSALQSLQVAQGLAELGGVGPFGGKGPTGMARSALGLDLLNIDIDQDDSAASTLTVGKYIADGLFVSATQDARGDSGSVRVEYEINQSFLLETELRQDGDQTVSANWKHDF